MSSIKVTDLRYTYATIVTLYQQLTVISLLNYLGLDKGLLWVFQPYVTLSRKVIVPLPSFDLISPSPQFLRLDELRSKGPRRFDIVLE